MNHYYHENVKRLMKKKTQLGCIRFNNELQLLHSFNNNNNDFIKLCHNLLQQNKLFLEKKNEKKKRNWWHLFWFPFWLKYAFFKNVTFVEPSTTLIWALN